MSNLITRAMDAAPFSDDAGLILELVAALRVALAQSEAAMIDLADGVTA